MTRRHCSLTKLLQSLSLCIVSVVLTTRAFSSEESGNVPPDDNQVVKPAALPNTTSSPESADVSTLPEKDQGQRDASDASQEREWKSAPFGGQIVSKVAVRGNLKIEADAILANVQTENGTRYVATQIRRDLKAVYSLGFFRDVQVDVLRTPAGLEVTFIVLEKPSVRSVRLEGNDELSKDDIQEIITLKLYSILNEATIQEDVVHIRDLYADKGYYLAEITPEVKSLNENEVEVLFNIKENDKVLVKRIYFVGSEKIDSSEYRRYLETKEAGILPTLNSKGAYNEDLVENDAYIIQAYYNEKGYIQAQVDPPQSFMSPDKKSIYVTFKVHEGERYKLGQFRVDGDLIAPADELVAKLKSKAGDWFSRSVLNEDIQALTDFYSDAGYAFVNVVPDPVFQKDGNVVDIVFRLEKGEQVSLHQINVMGNSTTWDKTIRRELPINEGELYRGIALKDGKRRLERLGYFEEVKLTTPKAGSPSELNMDVDVSEKATGTFNVGAGFSTFENFIFNATISKENFLGLGYVMGASAQLSAKRQLYNLSFYDPYFLDTRWTFRVDGYNIEQQYLQREYRRGANVSLGHYVGRSDDARFSMKYTIEDVGLRDLDPATQYYLGGDLTRGGRLSSLEANFSSDHRNNRITPTSGYLFSVSSELAGGLSIGDHYINMLDGDFSFHRHQVNLRWYKPLYRKVEDIAVFRLNFTAGAVWPTDGKALPMLHRYRAGGINSVRGYYTVSLGPYYRVTSTTEPSHRDGPWVVGGYQVWTNNFEVEFSLIKQAGIRGVVFLDVGNAFDLFGYDAPHLISDMLPRAGTGFGIRWFSPMGPLRFEWGFPIRPREGEQKMVFEFTIGSFF